VEELGNGLTWLVLVVAAIVGYFVVSKLIDFFRKDSTYRPEDTLPEDPDNGKIGGVDPTKPIG
jgi:hypothetical protein